MSKSCEGEFFLKKAKQTKTIFILSYLIIMWGLNWPLTKLGLDFAPPLLFAGLRTILGGLVLLIFTLHKYKNLRLKENWHLYIISSFLNVILFYGLQSIGLSHMPAGLFSAIVYLQPLLLGIFSWLWLGESMHGLRIVGLILGFLGVAVLGLSNSSGHISFIGIMLALGAAIGWGGGTVLVKKISDRVDMIWMVALQLLFGGILLLGIGFSVEKWSNIIWNTGFISNLLFISIFIIAVGWLAFFVLINSGEATKVGSYTFLIPLFSIVSSSVILDEVITINLMIGLMLIIVSIYFVNSRPKSLGTNNPIVKRQY